MRRTLGSGRRAEPAPTGVGGGLSSLLEGALSLDLCGCGSAALGVNTRRAGARVIIWEQCLLTSRS